MYKISIVTKVLRNKSYQIQSVSAVRSWRYNRNVWNRIFYRHVLFL